MGFKGIDNRQSGDRVLTEALLLDSSNAIVTTGTATVRYYELQSDGTLKSFDFSSNTFKTTALTTATASLTHRTGDNATVNTGIWTYAQTTVSGFTRGNVYYEVVEHSSAVPTVQVRKFQYGEGEGDLTVNASGQADANVRKYNGNSTLDSGDFTLAYYLAIGSNSGLATAAAVWNALTSGFGTAGSIGKKLKDWVLGTDNKALLSTDAQTGVVLPRVTLTDTVTTYTGDTPQTGDAYAVVNHATYGNAKLVRATTPNNTLDVSATGEAGVDWANVGGQTTTVNLTNTTVNAATSVTNSVNVGKWNGNDVSWDNGPSVNVDSWHGATVVALSATFIASDAAGTVASTTGTTTTLDAGAVATNDYHKGDLLRIVSGTGAGQSRVITAYTSGRVATHAAWVTNPTASSRYVIEPGRANVVAFNGTLSAGTAGYVGIDWSAVNAPTTTLNLSGTTISTSQAVASVAGAVGSVTGNVGGSVASVTAGVTVTTNNDKTGYALTSGERDSIAAALLDLASGVETSVTVRQALRGMASVLMGLSDGAATTTMHFRDLANSKNRITATVDADGNRSAVTRDLT